MKWDAELQTSSIHQICSAWHTLSLGHPVLHCKEIFPVCRAVRNEQRARHAGVQQVIFITNVTATLSCC